MLNINGIADFSQENSIDEEAEEQYQQVIDEQVAQGDTNLLTRDQKAQLYTTQNQSPRQAANDQVRHKVNKTYYQNSIRTNSLESKMNKSM
jgi:hypothetical protein